MFSVNTSFGCPNNAFNNLPSSIQNNLPANLPLFFTDNATVTFGCAGPAYDGGQITVTCEVVNGEYDWVGLNNILNQTNCQRKLIHLINNEHTNLFSEHYIWLLN